MFAMSQGIGAAGYSQVEVAAPNGAKKPRQEEKMTCLPVTIRSIEAAVAQSTDAGGEVKFFGSQPHMLLMVAFIETLQKSETACEMSLTDSTGRIKARYYVTDQSEDADALVPGTYVALFGTVRSAPALHFSITGARQVTTADEVSYHLIEAAHAALKLQKGQLDPATPSPKKPAQPVAAAVSPSGAAPMDMSPEKGPFPAVSPSPVKPSAPAAKCLEGEELKSAVLSFLQKESPARGDEGLAFDEIAAQMAPSAGKEVRDMLLLLVEEGEVIVTVDDDHFSTNV